jgi:hypothetical protein
MIYLTNNEQEACDQISKIDRCSNCANFTQKDLFYGKCSNPEGSEPFNVGFDDTCECFYAREKKVRYWIDKLVQMAMDASGVSDFNKQLEYHQANGTDYEFLGLKK